MKVVDVEAKAVKVYLEKNIADLEKVAYMYETVVKPRAERDKQILEQMRAEHLKLLSLLEKKARGEPVTNEEIAECVPKPFR